VIARYESTTALALLATFARYLDLLKGRFVEDGRAAQGRIASFAEGATPPT
jgi:hypothetical protein